MLVEGGDVTRIYRKLRCGMFHLAMPKERCGLSRHPPVAVTAGAALDAFLENYEAKYFKATECLRKDRDELLAFYDFPTEHWRHLRTTNPIESTFLTIRLRHRRTKGNGSRVA